MKSKRYNKMRKNKSRKNKKGGFFNFFSSNSTVVPSECDPNNLSMIKDTKSMKDNYQKCCPKGMFGSKNSSPYCKQLDLNFTAGIKGENDAREYTGFSPEEVYQMKNAEHTFTPDINTPKQKSWYQFWGGKKSRRTRNKRNKYNYSMKNRN
jgi:hypothetical protein